MSSKWCWAYLVKGAAAVSARPSSEPSSMQGAALHARKQLLSPHFPLVGFAVLLGLCSRRILKILEVVGFAQVGE